jgi:hypothetical protein
VVVEGVLNLVSGVVNLGIDQSLRSVKRACLTREKRTCLSILKGIIRRSIGGGKVELKTDISDYDVYDLSGSDFTKQFYKPPREADYEYNENSIPLGVTKHGEVYTIDLKDANRAVWLGSTGSGKTFLKRGFQDRLTKVKYSVLDLTDVKNECWSSNHPVQQKFRKNLLAGEEPCGAPWVILRPTFFRKVDEVLPPYNYWYSPLLSEMEYIDFTTILGLDDKQASQNQKDAAQAIYNEMRKDPLKYKSFNDFEKLIDANKDLTDKQKTTFKLRIKNLFESEFFTTGKDVVHDALEWTSQGVNVGLNLEGYDLFAKTGSGYPQVLVSMTYRAYLKTRRSALNQGKSSKYKMNRLFVFIDEANSFAPKLKEPSSKVELMDSVKRDRRYGVYIYFMYQTWDDIPETVITQTEYCFLPFNVTLSDMAKAFEIFNKGMRVDSQRLNNLRKILKECKKHDWIVLRKSVPGHVIITPLSPMSKHLEMSK